MSRKPPSDPEFAAEMERLAAERHAAFLARPPGDGKVAVEAAIHDLAERDYPTTARLTSVLRPTGRCHWDSPDPRLGGRVVRHRAPGCPHAEDPS